MRYANYSSGSCIILQASHPSGVERFPSIRRVQNQVHEYFRIFRDELRGRDFDHGAGGSQGLVEAASSTSAFAPSHGRAASTYGVVRSYHRLNVAYGQPLPTLEELEDRGLFIRIQGLSYSLAALAVELLHGGTGTQVRLIPERTYGTSGALRSISYAERPDVAVEVVPVGEPAPVYFFDPKDKLDGEPVHGDGSDGKPRKGDIDKMHAYRDAIRDASGGRVVRSAAILYPGPAVRYAAGIEALPTCPDAE